MGVTFSDSIDDEVNARRAQEDRGGGLFEKDSINRNKLRMGKLEAKKLVEAYGHHCFLPVTGRDELWSLFSTVCTEVLIAHIVMLILRHWVLVLRALTLYSAQFGKYLAKMICELILI